jgi:ketosteroid isomerase-like protein
MTLETEVLQANETFYEAFTRRDVAAMSRLWADDVPVSCIHPGWTALDGRDAVMKSWQAILSGPNPPAIKCEQPMVHIHHDMAIVLCYERIGEELFAATNIFVRRQRKWRMVHHQAGHAREPLTEKAAGRAEPRTAGPGRTVH